MCIIAPVLLFNMLSLIFALNSCFYDAALFFFYLVFALFDVVMVIGYSMQENMQGRCDGVALKEI